MSKRLLGVLVGLASFAAISSAAVVNCGSFSPLDIIDAAPGTPSAITFACGGLSFSNFNAVDAGNAAGLPLNLVSATFDTNTGIVLLSFNPNLQSLGQDFWLYFQVTGGVNQLDLTNGGTLNTSIQETACSTAIDTNGNICTGGSANLLGNTPLVAGGQQATVFSSVFPVTSPIYIFKDISTGHEGDTHMTSFSQSFHVIPEPMTLSMMGIGLLGLGLMRRRQQRKK